MIDFLHRRTRTQIVAAVIAALMILGVVLVAAYQRRSPRDVNNAKATHPATRVDSPSASASPDPTPTPKESRTTSPVDPLPTTTSADAYAAAVARALWGISYANQSRVQAIAFWHGELAETLPAGVPPGTTLAEAQNAAMSTLDAYLPSATMWPTLAADHTASNFTHVTAVSEPASWVLAISSGKIADPGLTARTVVGVQTLTYGAGATRTTSRQTQQLTVVMLGPPTSRSCRIEIIPPADGSETG